MWTVYVLNIVQTSLLMNAFHIKYPFKYFILFLIMCACMPMGKDALGGQSIEDELTLQEVMNSLT